MLWKSPKRSLAESENFEGLIWRTDAKINLVRDLVSDCDTIILIF